MAMPPVSADENSDSARAVTQRGEANCTEMLNSAIVRMLAAPARKRPAQVSTSEWLKPTTTSATPDARARIRVAASLPNRSRTQLTIRAPATAPTPLEPSRMPNVLALPASRSLAINGPNADAEAPANPNRKARTSTVRTGPECSA
jgi:hypothetical protein